MQVLILTLLMTLEGPVYMLQLQEGEYRMVYQTLYLFSTVLMQFRICNDELL